MSLFFLFVQFEFTHAVGPHAARYVVEPLEAPVAAGEPRPEEQALDLHNQRLADVSRGIGAADVLVVGIVAAPAGGPRLLRRARPVARDAESAEVPLSLVTYVKATRPFRIEGEARDMLGAIGRAEERQDAWVDEGIAVLNRAIRAHRAGTQDPYAIEVTRRDARRVRIGYGNTEDVQQGGWRSALDIPPPAGRRSSRAERLRPAEAVAAALAGRTPLLEAEDLLLRSLVDLDNDRTRGAAFQLGAALRLLPAELATRFLGAGPDLALLAPRIARAAELEREAAARDLTDAEADELAAIAEATADLLEGWRTAPADVVAASGPSA